MRKSRFTEQEIVGAVKQIEAGVPAKDWTRKCGASLKSLCSWLKRYAELAPCELESPGAVW